jgi:hypothetical protein
MTRRCLPILLLVLLVLAPRESAGESRYESLDVLPADFPFPLRTGDVAGKIGRSTSASARIVTAECRSSASVDVVAGHYKKTLEGMKGFRVVATAEDRTLSNGRGYRYHALIAVSRHKARIAISINNMDKGRTVYHVTWHHYTAPPKGAPAGWTPAIYR